jgi:hypothetical protein
MLQAQQEQECYAGAPSMLGTASGCNLSYADYYQQQQQLLARAAGARRSRRNSCYASLGRGNPFLQQFMPAQPASNRPKRHYSYSVNSTYEQQLFMQQQALFMQQQGSVGGLPPFGMQHSSSSSLLWQQQQQQQLLPPSYVRKPRRNSVCSMQGDPGAAAAAAAAAYAAATEYRPPAAAAARRQRRASWSCPELEFSASGIPSSSSNAGNIGQGPQPPLQQLYSGYHVCSTDGGMPGVSDTVCASYPLPGMSDAADSRPGSSSSTPRAAAAAKRVQWAQTQLPLHEEEQAPVGMIGTPFAAAAVEGQVAAPDEAYDDDDDYEDDSHIETYGAGAFSNYSQTRD